MMKMSGNCPRLEGQAHMFYCAVQFSFYLKALSASTESVIFGDTEATRRNQKKQFLGMKSDA